MSDGFLSRWARRKEAVKAAEQAPPTHVPTEVSAELTEPLRARALTPREDGDERAPDATVSDDRTAAADASADSEEHLLELPSLDALTPETDLTPFLRSGVPAALRNAALRRMWSLDPSIRDFVSEAREYAYDWNTPGGVPGMGPLLPSDDVKAMLGRLFRDPAEAKPEPESPEEAPESEPTEPEAADIAQVDVGGALPKVEPASENVAVAPVSAPNPPRPEPRLRRHGGAIPT